jgi:hypothetical protein
LGKGKKFLTDAPRVVDFLLGGWQTNGIATVRSGQAMYIRVATVRLNAGTTENWANITCSEVNQPKKVEQWFDTSCFSAPAQFQFGNSGKGHVRGPGLVNFDLLLFKKFASDEKRSIEFRSEFFNAFNNPHFGFGTPTTTQGASTFGKIDRTILTPREIQLGLKLTF